MVYNVGKTPNVIILRAELAGFGGMLLKVEVATTIEISRAIDVADFGGAVLKVELATTIEISRAIVV